MDKNMANKAKKIISATAALCLFGTALAGVSGVEASANEPAPVQAWTLDELMAPVWEGDRHARLL